MGADPSIVDAVSDTFDARAFRQALGSFPTGVAIVTTVDWDGNPVGITCNSFSSVSLTPPLVLWSLRTASRSLETYQKARGFAINVLSAHQSDLSNRFASSAIAEKFDGVDYALSSTGLPLINACIATFQCRTVAQYPEGDHVIFIGHVEQFGHGQEYDPLIFCKGAYAVLTESLRSILQHGNIPSAHLYQARAALHDAVVRLACRHGTEGDFAALQDNLAKLEACAASGDFTGRSEAALEFFNLIAKAAHNEVLQVLTGSLTQIMGRALAAQSQNKFRPELMSARRQILASLRQRDPTMASQALSEYLHHLQADKGQIEPSPEPVGLSQQPGK